jgi:hypothetical protein
MTVLLRVGRRVMMTRRPFSDGGSCLGRAALAAIGVIALASCVFAIATRAATNAPGLPAPVTLEGIAGVVPHATTLGDVRTRWRVRSRLKVSQSGSQAYGHLPVCAGRMQGQADFFGADNSAWLLKVWFWAGAKTDKGVGIGSTRAQVERAYGTRIAKAEDFTLVSKTKPPRSAIRFVISERSPRVTALMYGLLAEVENAVFAKVVKCSQ